MNSDPRDNSARQFALSVVKTLRDAGFQALWAGGCVRDRLLGLQPKDYDVATDATPDEVQRLFGPRRTYAVGAAFGVITVCGSHGAGQIEVATFREDAGYSDGRRPDSVLFSSPEQDALRRDYTINGLFYDPLDDRVIDYVGGQDDLQKQIVRAIGDPAARIAEDKLRMMRCVRFATRFGFTIDPSTAAQVKVHAGEIHHVSAERITSEFRQMMAHASRADALALLHKLDLLVSILPETGRFADEPGQFEFVLDALRLLDRPTFELAWCNLLWPLDLTSEQVDQIARQWKLTNDERQSAVWILRHEPLIRESTQIPWPQLQRMLIQPSASDCVSLARATRLARHQQADGAEYAQERLAWPIERLNPPPLVDGQDLKQIGLSPGRAFRELLDAVRDRQLEGELTDRAAALDWLRQRIEAKGD